MTSRVPIYAHRGASSHCVENTFAAFKKAKSLGADGIELDVQLSKDHVFVVFHDLDLKRMAGRRRNIAQCTFDELRTYKLGSRWTRCFFHNKMEALQTVIDWANEQNIALNIELKQSLLQREDHLREFLKDLQLPAASHFSSFHMSLLQIVKEVQPQMETAIIITKKFDWSQLSAARDYDVIHAHKKYYKRHYLKLCEQANIGIRFYGITGNEVYLKEPHRAVLGWITDFPNKVRKAQK